MQDAPSRRLFTGLGLALRTLRQRRGLKQMELAEKARLSKGTLSQFETGQREPSLHSLGRLLEALDCDLHELQDTLVLVTGGRNKLLARRYERGDRGILRTAAEIAHLLKKKG
jgi:transcriptional regulator with XRE-family HTH domain